MRVLVTGVNGQLGHDLVNELSLRGHTAYASDITPVYSGDADGSAVTEAEYVPLDITDKARVREVISDIKPDTVIHAAGWTDVDGAEKSENREKVFRINADGTENIARLCRETGAAVVYISTDYVFSGEGTEPWKPDEKNFQPLNVYGESKLKGEEAVADILEKYYIVRTAWVFGRNGKNFVKTMLRLASTRDTLSVVDDQIGTPTYTIDLSRLLVDMIESGKYGYYHATNEGGYISWADFAEEIFRESGFNTKVIPVSSEEYGLSPAKRPHNSRLDKTKLDEEGFKRLPEWKDALQRYLEELGAGKVKVN